jgi:hypothetical protein
MDRERSIGSAGTVCAKVREAEAWDSETMNALIKLFWLSRDGD